MSERNIRRRIGALVEKIGAPVSDDLAAKSAALAVLRAASMTLCGSSAGRDSLCRRVAAGHATDADNAVLDGLPLDALRAAGMKTPTEYARLVNRLLSDF